jgi:hypothetical protein
MAFGDSEDRLAPDVLQIANEELLVPRRSPVEIANGASK